MPKAQPLLLDLYPSAAVAYSLRKLRTAYSGNAIRVRRSSDNAEQNIGFVSNVLDTASLLTFVGANNGFVTTWYDQSGAARNATNATAINQPNIVTAGVVEIQNSKPSLYYDGTKKLGTSYVLTYPFSMFKIAKRLSTGLLGLVATQRVGNITAGNFATYNASGFLTLRHPTVIDANIADTANLFLGYSGRVGNIGYVGINNSALNNSATLTVTQYTQNVGIGGALASADRLWNGYISEVIMYASDNSTNRTPIETNINSFYTIY